VVKVGSGSGVCVCVCGGRGAAMHLPCGWPAVLNASPRSTCTVVVAGRSVNIFNGDVASRENLSSEKHAARGDLGVACSNSVIQKK
jgi:hypothetical protein